MNYTLDKRIPEEITLWQMVMLILSIYVLIALFVDTVCSLPEELSILLNRIDNFICLIFIADFSFHLIKAESKRQYLKWGWIDLASSIPNLQILRWARIARVIRIFHILRSIRSTKRIVKFLFKNRAKGIFATVAMTSCVLIIFSSIAVLNCEVSPNSNIKTASDALWWSFITITTVGYGDYYPTTLPGRLIAVVLTVAGLGLVGTFTAYVATIFLQQEEAAEEKRENKIIIEIIELKKQIAELKNKQ